MKQDLSREHILYAGKKAESVRGLLRTSTRIPHAGSAYDPRPLRHILAGLVAYQISWIPAFGGPFRNALGELRSEARLDLGCALVHGAFQVAYGDAKTGNIALAEGPRPLVQFLMRLLKQLQAVGTAPAIDYEACLAAFAAAAGEVAD